MKIGVDHTTVYGYESPVFLEPHTFRMRPRADGSQRLVSSCLTIEPVPAGLTECLDQDGNSVVTAWFSGTTARLAVRNRFEVETLRENPFDFILAGKEAEALPAPYAEHLRPWLAPYLEAGGEVPEPVAELARSLARNAGWRTLPFLAALNSRVYSECRHVARMEGPPLEAGQTLAAREGSCRDLAVLFREACRSVGLAARFVSGYEIGAANEEPAYMHAWTEVYLPGGGWRGYDPSRGLAVSTQHVACAAAFDPALAAPVTGNFRGSVRTAMEVSLTLRYEE